MDKLPKLPPVTPSNKPTETIATTYEPPSNNSNISIDDTLQTITVIINGVKKLTKDDGD